MSEVKIIKNKRKKINFTPYAIVCGIVLLAYSIIIMFPMLWGVMNTFKHYVEFDPTMNTVNTFPKLSLFKNPDAIYRTASGEQITSIFANYIVALNRIYVKSSVSYYTGLFTQRPVNVTVELGNPGLSGGSTSTGFASTAFGAMTVFLYNTVLTCFAGSILPIIICCIMAYMCAKYKYKFSGFIYGIVIFSMACPVIGTQSSMLSMQKRLGIYDNMLGFMIFNANFSSMYFMVFFAFFQGLPDSYLEAAEIDGASQFKILLTIAIPLAGTVIWASFVMIVIVCWNDYNTPLVYLPTHPTLAYAIYYNTVESPKTYHPPIVLATTMYLVVPATIFFLLLRKKLMGNLSMGGIKG